MKYLLILFVTICTFNSKGQNTVFIELKNETIDGFNFPIKIGGVYSDIDSKDLGTVFIPEFNANYPLRLKNSVESTFSAYLSYIQTGETFLDTVYLDIKTLQISEERKLDLEESHLTIVIDFIRLRKGQKEVVSTYSDVVIVSDPNVTLFHEYNIRLAISKSLKWFTTQDSFAAFKTNMKDGLNVDNSNFIKTTTNSDVFVFNDSFIYDFNQIEEISARTNNKAINNLIRKHKVKQSIGTIFAGLGVTGGLVGYGICKYGDETQGSKILVGSVLSFLLGTAIWNTGEAHYKSQLIQEYNKSIIENNSTVFTPNNPIKLSLSVPLR